MKKRALSVEWFFVLFNQMAKRLELHIPDFHQINDNRMQNIKEPTVFRFN